MEILRLRLKNYSIRDLDDYNYYTRLFTDNNTKKIVEVKSDDWKILNQPNNKDKLEAWKKFKEKNKNNPKALKNYIKNTLHMTWTEREVGTNGSTPFTDPAKNIKEEILKDEQFIKSIRNKLDKEDMEKVDYLIEELKKKYEKAGNITTEELKKAKEDLEAKIKELAEEKGKSAWEKLSGWGKAGVIAAPLATLGLGIGITRAIHKNDNRMTDDF